MVQYVVHCMASSSGLWTEPAEWVDTSDPVPAFEDSDHEDLVPGLGFDMDEDQVLVLGG